MDTNNADALLDQIDHFFVKVGFIHLSFSKEEYGWFLTATVYPKVKIPGGTWEWLADPTEKLRSVLQENIGEPVIFGSDSLGSEIRQEMSADLLRRIEEALKGDQTEFYVDDPEKSRPS